MAMPHPTLLLCLSLTLHLANPQVLFAQFQGKGSPLSPVSVVSGTSTAKEGSSEKKEETQSAGRGYPGLAEVIPSASELAREAVAAGDRIASIRDTSSVEKKIALAEARHLKLKDQVQKMGDPGSWDFNRLSDVRVLLQGERKEYEALLQPISTLLGDLESLRKDWEGKQEYWKEWKKRLESSQTELPLDTFKKVSETTQGVLQELTLASGELVTLQERFRKLLDESLSLANPIDAALTKMRSEIFKKVEPSLLSSEFLAQWDSFVLQTLRGNVSKAWRTESTLFFQYSWILLLRIAVILLVGFGIRRSRTPEMEEGQWKFVLRHPWASGVLLSKLTEMLFTGESTGFMRVVSQIFVVFSICILASALDRDRREQVALFTLGVILILSDTLKMVSFSTPLYRLYLAGASLAGLAMVVLWARAHARATVGRRDLLSVILLLGGGAFSVVVLAQMLGFANLSERVFFASAWTIFICVGISLTYRLSVFGLEMLLSRPIVAGLRFFSRYGAEFTRRLTVFMKVAYVSLAVLTLSQAWGFFSSPSKAWEKVFESKAQFAGLSLSLGLVLVALFVLYLAGSISWFLRAFLEAEVFPRNQIDRGAGDAVKKLLHYSLILMGFLVGLSALGIDAKSFFVLGGALGIGIGFGLQNIVNNFISGLILLFERPIKIGDMVVVENESGRVRKIGLRSTVIETFDRAELIVPNSQFISQKVTNWTFSNPLARLKIPVGAAYGTDIPLVLGLLKEAALMNSKVLKSPQPVAFFVRFGDSSLDFELHVWIMDVADRLAVQSEIGQAIASGFREAGIEIPFPQREVHVRTAQG
jgi:potassium-dependent mechanosensitive channel